MTEALDTLRSRVRAATGADRELDADISRAFGLAPAPFLSNDRWTGSIDAALALVERVLPGWIVDVATTGAAWVWDNAAPAGPFSAWAATPPLAILDALLTALIDKTRDDDRRESLGAEGGEDA